MLVESLIAGLIIGFCVSYFLLRFFDKIPTKNPILKALILSFVAMVIIEVLSTLVNPNNASVYLLIDTGMNVLSKTAEAFWYFEKVHPREKSSSLWKKIAKPDKWRSLMPSPPKPRARWKNPIAGCRIGLCAPASTRTCPHQAPKRPFS